MAVDIKAESKPTRWTWKSGAALLLVLPIILVGGWWLAGIVSDVVNPENTASTPREGVSAPRPERISRSAKTQAYYRASATELSDRSTNRGRLVRGWTFAGGIPNGWNSIFGARIQKTPTVLGVQTRKGKFDYQLQSSVLNLAPGSYKVFLKGAVIDGGLHLGVLDARRNRWLASALFWWGQDGFDRLEMGNPFLVARRMRVRILLTNWAPIPTSSFWQLRYIELRRRGG